MTTIILTRGVPASGKSTWAHSTGWPVISRDDIRRGVFGAKTKTVLDKDKEKEVTKIQRQLVEMYALENKQFVIIADTNLNNYYMKQWGIFAEHLGCDVMVKDFPVSLSDAIQYNLHRNASEQVTTDVIKQCFKTYKIDPETGILPKPQVFHSPLNINITEYVPDLTKPHAVVVDIDNTLADNTHRSPYDFDKCDTDEVILHTKQVVNALRYFEGTRIIYLSGREEKYRDKTETWLDKHGLYDFETSLLMRPTGDKRRDWVVKNELFDKYIALHYCVDFVIDDRVSVCRMWEKKGLDVMRAREGMF